MQTVLMDEIFALKKKVETLEQLININESSQVKKIADLESKQTKLKDDLYDVAGKKIEELQYKFDQLNDGHVFIEHMGLVGYQHKMQIIGKHGFSIERENTHSELTIIKQDAERADI